MGHPLPRMAHIHEESQCQPPVPLVLLALPEAALMLQTSKLLFRVPSALLRCRCSCYRTSRMLSIASSPRFRPSPASFRLSRQHSTISTQRSIPDRILPARALLLSLLPTPVPA